MKICKNCVYYAHIIQNPAAPEVWYNHFCRAMPLEPGIDSVTGEPMYKTRNDFGRMILVENPYEYCRNVNIDGNCELFQER